MAHDTTLMVLALTGLRLANAALPGGTSVFLAGISAEWRLALRPIGCSAGLAPGEVPPRSVHPQPVDKTARGALEHEPFLVHLHPSALQEGSSEQPTAIKQPVHQHPQSVEIPLPQAEHAGGCHAVAVHGSAGDPAGPILPFVVDESVRLVTNLR